MYSAILKINISNYFFDYKTMILLFFIVLIQNIVFLLNPFLEILCMSITKNFSQLSSVKMSRDSVIGSESKSKKIIRFRNYITNKKKITGYPYAILNKISKTNNWYIIEEMQVLSY